MPATTRDSRFDHAIEEWVRAAFSRGVRSFPDLVLSLPGVYPADALRALTRLQGELPPGWNVAGSHSARPTPDGWPVEHPLDFDWRFTPETARLLIDRGPAAGPVAFLGAPSLAREAALCGRHLEILLFDQNPALVTAVRRSFPGVNAVCTDLVWGEPVEAGRGEATVADPPWYPEHILAFLWAASRLTRLGGRVLLSLPPKGTRPGVSAEREAVFGAALTSGLRLDAVESGVLAYRSPQFEQNALAAARVPPVPLNWRRGDLAVFAVAEKTAAPRPAPLEAAEKWDEESVGIVRIKCRKSAYNDFRDPALSPVAPGDILASVSRRDPARAVADVWTCCNRVFRCAGTGVFRVIVSALGRGDQVEGAVTAAMGRRLSAEEASLVRRAAGQAADLVRREERDLAEDARRRYEHDMAEAV